MDDKIISLDRFKKVTNEVDEELEAAFKAEMLAVLDGIKERVQAGDTVAFAVLETGEQLGSWRTNTMGFSSFDLFSAVGVLEAMKFDMMDDLRQ